MNKYLDPKRIKNALNHRYDRKVFDKKLVKQMMRYVGINEAKVFLNNISVEYFGTKI